MGKTNSGKPDIGKRFCFPLSFGKLYITAGTDFCSVTVPFENTEEKRSLRQTVDRICANIVWRGRVQFQNCANKLSKDESKWVKAELKEVIPCICYAMEQVNENKD